MEESSSRIDDVSPAKRNGRTSGRVTTPFDVVNRVPAETFRVDPDVETSFHFRRASQLTYGADLGGGSYNE